MRIQAVRLTMAISVVALCLSVCLRPVHADEGHAALAEKVLRDTGVKGGVVVHLGCGDPASAPPTAALRRNESFIVQGLDRNEKSVQKARAHVRSLGLYGKVTVRQWQGEHLPYIGNFVNLIVCEAPAQVPQKEIMRVLAPNGVAYIKKNGNWEKTVKPWPGEIDEWTHWLHDATGNAVAHDTAIGPPRHMQWVAPPKWSRHHQLMGSVQGLVSSGGRVFYVVDEAPRSVSFLPAEWRLVARDAFNGTLLWKREIEKWWSHLWLLKSGPFQLNRRVVAKGDRVYLPLGSDAPLSAVDAATGETVHTYKDTAAAREVVVSDGTLFVVAYKGTSPKREPYSLAWIVSHRRGERWSGEKNHIMAVRGETGEVLWDKEDDYVPGTLAADAKRVCFYNRESVVCVDPKSGRKLWVSEPLPGPNRRLPAFMPSLVLCEDVVLFVGRTGNASTTALAADTGKQLWSARHPRGEYASPKHIFVAQGLVWTGNTQNNKNSIFTGRDPHTGEVKKEVTDDVATCWYHHRCYPPKATENYILASHSGLEFADMRGNGIEPHHWVRGSCSYGIMPANGLVYTPPHPCACYMLGTLKGFNALASESESRKNLDASPAGNRLEKGPAYAEPIRGPQSAIGRPDAWPTYRHDAERSGWTEATVPAKLERKWRARLGGKLSSVTVADGKVFVASVDTHSVHALDADSGKFLWSYTTDGRVDTPPTLWKGRALFGSADGRVYCLRAADGALIWRYRVAPRDLQMGAHGRVESVWPVHGGVLVRNGAAYCVAGRSMFVDGGLRLVRLDPATGKELSETVLDEYNPETSVNVHKIIGTEYFDLSMPTMLPDVLSSDGEFVYMRSQRFDMKGKRLKPYVPKWPIPEWRGGFGSKGREILKGKPLEPWFEKEGEKAHLFASAGLLDDSYFHRNIWVYAGSFLQGVAGYRYMGRLYPAGKILVFDDSNVYGYGNRPEYFTEFVHTEFRLFGASKTPRHEVFQTEERMFSHGPKQKIVCNWSEDEVPLFARAMALADRTLLVAGPPNLIRDAKLEHWEGAAGAQRLPLKMDTAKLAAQSAAWRGEKGGLMWAVDAGTGARLAEYKLGSPPVWDGMAVAGGQVYLATLDGSVLCMSGK